MSSAVVGIDIGSYSCYLSVARKGGLETLLNEYSDRCTHSCISFSKNTRFIGNSAKMQLASNPKNSIDYFVPLVGKKFTDNILQMELPYLAYRVIEDKESIAIEVNYLGKSLKIKPEQLMAMLVTKLRYIAESELKMNVTHVVVNVPALYTAAERRCVSMALQIAGVECVRLINDLTAVALLYHATRFQSLSQTKLVVFVDVGYSYLQLSLVRFGKDNFQVLLETFEPNLGGREFDRIIFNHLTKVFKEKYSIDVRDSLKASIRLMNESEKIKKRLSANAAEFTVNVECLMNDLDVSTNIDRVLFEELSVNILNSMNSLITNFLGQCSQIIQARESISCVELVGGSSRIPCVKQLIAELFKQEPQITLNADEAVSRGCALQCAMLNTNCVIRRIEYAGYTPYGITLDMFNNQQNQANLMKMDSQNRAKHRTDSVVLINPGQPYPLIGGFIELSSDIQLIEIRYSDRNAIPNDNKVIGFLKINPDSYEVDKMCKLMLEFEINASGLFNITGLTLKRNSKTPRSGNQPSQQAIQNKAPQSAHTYNSPLDNQSQKKSMPKNNKQHNNFDMYGPVDFKISYLMDISENELNNMVKKEGEFIAKDNEETERLNSKNKLEENIYKYREILNGLNESKKFNSKDIESAMTNLNDEENWLFGDGEDVGKQKYMEHIEKLDKMMTSFNVKPSRSHRNVSNAEEELINLIKDAENEIHNCNLNHASSESTESSQTHNQQQSSTQSMQQSQSTIKSEIDRLKQFIDQGHEVLKNVSIYSSNHEEFDKFISDFRNQLDRVSQQFSKLSQQDSLNFTGDD